MFNIDEEEHGLIAYGKSGGGSNTPALSDRPLGPTRPPSRPGIPVGGNRTTLGNSGPPGGISLGG